MSTVNPEQQTEQQTAESGLRFDRVWWLREQVAGHVPDDPEWQVYSDHLINFTASIDPGTERVDGLGTADAVDFSPTVEENEITIAYSLMQQIVDENDNFVDALADAALRNEANQIPNTHSMVARDNNPTKGPYDDEGLAGLRQYIVIKGAKANLSLEPDTEDENPTPAELTYTPEKARSYLIAQPDDPTTVTAYVEYPEYVDESDKNDDAELAIESEDGADEETIQLDGETEVTGEVQFGDIDAIELSEECDGEVIVENEAGSQITQIHGALHYSKDESSLEGDLGVPALENGSTPEPIGNPPEDFAGDRVERPVGAGLAPTLNNMTLEVENDFEPQARQNSTRVTVHEGNRTVTLEADVTGEKASHDMIDSAFSAEGLDLEWELSRSMFTLPKATMTEPPDKERESDESISEVAGTYESSGLEITSV